MTPHDAILRALAHPGARRVLTARSLFAWERYYEGGTYDAPPAPFHAAWLDALDAGLNVVVVGARYIGKTVHVRSHVTRAVCHASRRTVIWACADKDVAEKRLGDIRGQLMGNARIQADFGRLHRKMRDEEDGENGRLTASDFVTNNGVRVFAASPGVNVRGANWQDRDAVTHRPDLIVVDDVDTNKTAYSPRLIDKLHNFVTGELVGGAQDGAQIVILGNVISGDGVAQRLYHEKKGQPGWACFWQPLVGPDDVIAWPERFAATDAEAAKTGKGSLETMLRNQGLTAYNQNVRLIPYLGGEGIFRRDWIRWATPEECVPGAVAWDYITAEIDPANSVKTYSDSFAIAVFGHRGKQRVMLDGSELKGEAKSDVSAVAEVVRLYRKWGANVAKCESVAYQATIARLLGEQGLAVHPVKRHKDKVTRAKEVQHKFQNGEVYFNPACPACQTAVDQLLAFPNVAHDDLVDVVVDGVGDERPGVFFSV